MNSLHRQIVNSEMIKGPAIVAGGVGGAASVSGSSNGTYGFVKGPAGNPGASGGEASCKTCPHTAVVSAGGVTCCSSCGKRVRFSGDGYVEVENSNGTYAAGSVGGASGSSNGTYGASGGEACKVCLHTAVVSAGGVTRCSLCFSAWVGGEVENFMAPMDKKNVFEERNYSAAEMDRAVKERNEARKDRDEAWKELDALVLRQKDDGHRRTAGRMGDEIGNLKSDYSLLLAENAKLRREIDRLNRRLTEATRKKGPYER